MKESVKTSVPLNPFKVVLMIRQTGKEMEALQSEAYREKRRIYQRCYNVLLAWIVVSYVVILLAFLSRP